MELGSLALRYVPFLLFMLIGLVVAFDGRTRLHRPSGARWSAIFQIPLGLVQATSAVVAIAVSPNVGLFEPGRLALTTQTTTTIYLAAAALALVTLLIGLARPARPHPRRGLTVLALVLDALAVAGCSYVLLVDR